MPVHSFGGAWTERKLSVIRRYLEVYAQALKNQPFQRVYVDAFAGTGARQQRRDETLPLLELPEFSAVAKGSVRLALEVIPPFHHYVFIERVSRRASELSALARQFPDQSIEVVNADANKAIGDFCKRSNWRSTRGVVFLDPYGMQVSWQTLVAISRTRALDAWVLFPTGIGLNRLLTKRGEIPRAWQDSLDRFLGTPDWRTAFYKTTNTPDLFEGIRQASVKDANASKLEEFIVARLRTIFPVVMEKGIALTNSKGQSMYLLCFVSANPSPRVRALATRLAQWSAEV